MNATPAVVSPDIAVLDQDLGPDRAAVIHALAALLQRDGRVVDLEGFVEAAEVREALGSTVLPGGIAMPHARSHAVSTASVAVARLSHPVEWTPGADPVRLVLMIAARGDDSPGYLALLQKVATACTKPALVADLKDARTPEGLADVVDRAIDAH